MLSLDMRVTDGKIPERSKGRFLFMIPSGTASLRFSTAVMTLEFAVVPTQRGCRGSLATQIRQCKEARRYYLWQGNWLTRSVWLLRSYGPLWSINFGGKPKRFGRTQKQVIR